MEAGDAHVVDLLDTVHHEMGKVVCSHHVCVVASDRTTRHGEGA